MSEQRERSELAIGVFDSGLGGVSVLNSIAETLPGESLIYYGDSAYAPYGTKSNEEVIERVFRIASRLCEEGIKALVVACNTATSVAVHLLREKYEIPILGLEPALKPAIVEGKEKILVLATEITLREKKFAELARKYEERAKIYKVPVGALVELAEHGTISPEGVEAILREALKSLYTEDFDAVVLGCTHFVFAKKEIQSLFPRAKVYDGNLGVAQNLRRILLKEEILQRTEKRKTLFLSSDEAMIARFQYYARTSK